ncbi:hypothetical protein GCM10009606_39470 [Nocardioides aquiterrae]|uniref:Uncharacterized protein n=2 Tax=Nocardioides aquiterrae TaxID=203799 RepID=A0ABP4F9Q1_9ACTN
MKPDRHAEAHRRVGRVSPDKSSVRLPAPGRRTTTFDVDLTARSGTPEQPRATVGAMNENPRSRILRRARLTTAAIAVTAVAGTAALTAVASNATANGGTGNTGSGTANNRNNHNGTRSQRTTGSRSTGVVPVPSNSQPQGGSNAS